ncbi:MAG: DUF4911 domain-containing protein [Polyangiaceae bacterium]|nr:DUF4911 domain-containing protein [Polyangiaceae bacterium]MCW5790746.1 DUF4911 domain-containing protein [Polyangiaceae bacterium]
MRGKLPAPVAGPEVSLRRLRIAARDVVYLKGILEASEGLAQLFAERGGEVTLVVHPSREAELDELLGELREELRLT